jgi:hypothetical protein
MEYALVRGMAFQLGWFYYWFASGLGRACTIAGVLEIGYMDGGAGGKPHSLVERGYWHTTWRHWYHFRFIPPAHCVILGKRNGVIASTLFYYDNYLHLTKHILGCYFGS